MHDIVDWTGASGRKYRYWFIRSVSAQDIQDVGGNYAFVKVLPNGNYFPVYFGQASSLRDRLPNHEVWASAVVAGATLVMGHTTPSGEADRLAEERDLIQHWNPPLNTHHRSVG